MKTNNTASRLLRLSALGLTLSLTGTYALADNSPATDSRSGTHMEGERTPQQTRDENTRGNTGSQTTHPGAGMHEDGNDPSGTDATRHVPGAPERGTNPETQPGTERD